MMNSRFSLWALVLMGLSSCVALNETTSRPHSAATYGVGGAATCAALGALTAPEGKSGRYARNGALVCGALGALAGEIAENSLYRLRQDIYLINPHVRVASVNNQLTSITIPENEAFSGRALNPNIQPVLAKISRYLSLNPNLSTVVTGYVSGRANTADNIKVGADEARAIADALKSGLKSAGTVKITFAGAEDEGGDTGNRIELKLQKH